MAQRRSPRGHPRPYQRSSDGRWLQVVTDIDGRHYLTAKTRKEVLAKYREAVARIGAGKRIRTSAVQAGPFLSSWLTDVVKGTVKPASYATYEGQILRLRDVCGAWPLRDIGPADVQRWVRILSDEFQLAPSTVSACYTRLRTALECAVEWELIDRNPCRHITLPAPRPSRARALSVEQARALLTAMEPTRYGVLIRLMLTTALRIGEALALTWEDLDEESSRLRVRGTLHWKPGGTSIGTPKSAASARTIDLDAGTVAALRAHRAQQRLERLAAPVWHDRDLIFPNTRGKPLADATVRTVFYQVTAEAGLAPLRLHDLRHTAATFMASMGVTLRELQEQLGHASGRTTNDIYGHILAGRREETARKMGALLQPETGVS